MWKCWFLRKNVILREKPLGSEKRTNNKLNPQVESPSAVELGPHELKASALNKAPSLVLGLQKNIHLICFCHLSSWGWNNGRGWLLRFLNNNIPYKLVPHKFSAVSVFQCTFVLAFDKLCTSTSKSTNTLPFERLFTSICLKYGRLTRKTSFIFVMKLWIKVRDSEKLRLVYPGKKVSFTLICTLKVFPTSISRNTKQKRKLSYLRSITCSAVEKFQM